MKVQKIKSVTPDFSEGSGPSETITLGIDVDGCFIGLGKYYFGPHMIDAHGDIFKKMEAFADECVKRFQADYKSQETVNGNDGPYYRIYSRKIKDTIGYTTCPDDVQEKGHCDFILCSKEEFEADHD